MKTPLRFLVEFIKAPAGIKAGPRFYKSRRAAAKRVREVWPRGVLLPHPEQPGRQLIKVDGATVGLVDEVRDVATTPQPRDKVRRSYEVRVLVDAAPAKPWARIAVCTGLEKPVRGAHWRLVELSDDARVPASRTGGALVRTDYPGLVFVTAAGVEVRP